MIRTSQLQYSVLSLGFKFHCSWDDKGRSRSDVIGWSRDSSPLVFKLQEMTNTPFALIPVIETTYQACPAVWTLH